MDSERHKYRYSIPLNVARIRGHRSPGTDQSNKHVLYDRIYDDFRLYGSRTAYRSKDLTQSEDNLPKLYNSKAMPPLGDVRENTRQYQSTVNSCP
ncbi:hypothetical protein DPMN_122372 [Dreissena polymorpha]|uniref:Uncharacterized protein n=1 Tax=Dreissena polymorpha TaxID=45954 RepID=A0A9D4JQH3_DREPO|nr:hypothetical protein DPMN_122372 [Dreissena polymorpha]